jgi:hypothetical protein
MSVLTRPVASPNTAYFNEPHFGGDIRSSAFLCQEVGGVVAHLSLHAPGNDPVATATDALLLLVMRYYLLPDEYVAAHAPDPSLASPSSGSCRSLGPGGGALLQR